MKIQFFHPTKLLIVALACGCALICAARYADSSEIAETSPDNQRGNQLDSLDLSSSSSKSTPANHRSENEESDTKSNRPSGRHSRQYDGSLGTSSTGNFASISGDGAAYVAQMPLGTSNYGSGSAGAAASYSTGDISSPYHSSSYHDPLSIARGYPSPPYSPIHHQAGYPPMSSSISPLSSMFSSGLGSSPLSSSMFPMISKGFDVSEIVCTAIAVAIGAVIVGAPFILIYLFVMNQMNGGGPNMGPSGGAISLTGPTSSTTVSGRKKRHTSLPEALMRQLSPLVNSEQVTQTFKMLMNSMAKYQL